MNYEWLHHEWLKSGWLDSGWLHYGLLGAGLIACLVLFLSLKREIWLAEQKAEKAQAGLESLLAESKREIEELRKGLKEAEERAGVLVPPSPPRSGLNLTKRSQALRMFRRGEGASQIASALGIPEQEVELLLKVHQIVLESA